MALNMKYVIFKHKTGIFMPIIIPQHITHSMVKIEDCEPVSAGFFRIDNETVIPYGDSTSLKLGPSADDAELIQNVLNNSGMYAFIV
jgi:hypothetical protein